MQGRLIEEQSPEKINGTFSIKYDGKPLSNHTFDAELYATSLLGFSQSFKKANKLIYHLDIDVNIEAEKEGSLESFLQFLIENQQTAEVINTYVDLVKNTAEASLWTGGCLFGTYKLLIRIIKAAKGKKALIKKEIQNLDINYKLKQILLKLLFNKTFRKGLDQLTFFLSFPNMEYVEITDQDNQVIKIDASERRYFIEQPEDEITVETDDKIVSIIYPSATRTKWRFIIDGMERWAEVTDIRFLREMKDKPLEYFEDIHYSATVETTAILKATALYPEISRKIFNFSLHTPPKQGQLF